MKSKCIQCDGDLKYKYTTFDKYDIYECELCESQYETKSVKEPIKEGN